MASLFSLEVYTPYSLFFSGKVESIVLNLPDGQVGVRAGHSPFVSPVVTCPLRVLEPGGTWREAAVSAGVLEVTSDKVVLLAGAAEWPDQIDRERAEAAAERARERLSEDLMRYEADRSRASLLRATNRLAVLDRSAVPTR